MDEKWRESAACAKAVRDDPELGKAWIDESGSLEGAARAVCDDCPVRRECALAAVFEERKVWGMRGGYFFRDSTLQPRDARDFAAEYEFRPNSRSRGRRRQQQRESAYAGSR